MARVNPVQKRRFLRSSRAATEVIVKGLYDSRSASSNTHWTLWSAFCANVTLNPVLLLYKDPIPILATFSAKYHHGNISASGKKVHFLTVEEAFHFIGQALDVMGPSNCS